MSNNNFETKYGHFAENGTEYVITEKYTPKPWVNVISNGNYGFVISQTGGGFSWLQHSEFNRITRWHQDLIRDDWGKYIYIKNNDTGEVWSPTWLPVRTEPEFYECRHGLGYTVFTTEYKGIKCELTLFAPAEETLEIWNIKISNNNETPADLSFYTYFEWCLGSSADHHREFHKTFIETKYDKKINSILTRKRVWDIPLGDRGHWNIEYEYNGFLSCSRKPVSYECDKEAFIGQYGTLARPKAVKEGKLTNSSGIWGDPIGCLKVDITVPEKSMDRLAFYLGLKKEETAIPESLKKFKSPAQIDKALAEVKSKWLQLLQPLQIKTPDPAMDLMVNIWLRYQAVSGRLWGRTAYYQQSGAFGFRDQLQDSLVFLPIDHSLTEKQIKLHAAHQFFDGTVLHWWHPITETGLPTKMTDDLLWLPFLLVHYLKETHNYNFLNEEVEYYDKKSKKESLFEHSRRAIDKVLERYSKRGLPLIGAGDWNDGLSAVGLDMKGESIWLAEFFYMILNSFSEVSRKMNKRKLADHYLDKAKELKKAFDKHAWDGKWFYRATKDSGEKIGSSVNEEGRIYLNAQTWSVISGIADQDKKIQAMNSVKEYLVKKNGPLLLYPAYTKPDKYIGYLSRYAAGRRENGGVYMHAATWSIWANALLRRNQDAYEIFKRICPVYNGLNPDEWIAEPYVTPGNIDGPDSINYGMAGWTWYTGSAAWFQKMIVDWILGIRAEEEGLVIDPCIPSEWDEYEVKRTFRGTQYNIKVMNPDHSGGDVKCIVVDGNEIKGNIVCVPGKKQCNVVVLLGN